MSIIIPPNSHPGQTIQIPQPNGTVINVTIPHNAPPGSMLTLNMHGQQPNHQQALVPSHDSITVPTVIDQDGARRFLAANQWPRGGHQIFTFLFMFHLHHLIRILFVLQACKQHF